MINRLPFYFRFCITAITVIVAGVVIYSMIENYFKYPWTRDAQVEADVVQLTSRVSGHIVELPVKENQLIKQGQVVWKIDPKTYQADVESEKASLQQAQASLKESIDVVKRVRHLTRLDTGAIADVKKIKAENDYNQALAKVSQAQASLKHAKLNLQYTVVRAPSDGYITNLQIAEGSFVSANQPVFPFVDANSFRLVGFFKETLIENVKPGDKAIITFMAYPHKPIEGVVNSISKGIYIQNGTPGSDLLPQVKPNFDWIRLAQRLPVRIHFNQLPQDIRLSVGFSASVVIRPGE